MDRPRFLGQLRFDEIRRTAKQFPMVMSDRIKEERSFARRATPYFLARYVRNIGPNVPYR